MDRNVEIVFRQEDVAKVIEAANSAGATSVEAPRVAGMTGVEIIVLAVLGARCLPDLIEKVMRLWSCGVTVDTRGERILTEKNCQIPRGSVLVIGGDGSEATLHEPARAELDSIIGRFLSTGTAG